MKIYSLIFPVLVFASTAQGADSITGHFTGRMATERGDETRFIDVTITQDGKHFAFSGGAGYSTGRSASPDFDGQSNDTKPPYSFKFEDSFGNLGIAIITPTKTGIQFSVTITTVNDSRCLPLYKPMILKKKKANKACEATGVSVPS